MSKDIRSISAFRDGKMSVAVLMTGGTIAKSYNPANARLYNFEPTVKDLFAGLRLDDLNLAFFDFMHLDSLDISTRDRDRIRRKIRDLSGNHDAVLVTHGTDTMVATAESLRLSDDPPAVPVIFTGAMIPGAIIGSDALQNITEALLALRFLPAGIYLSFHNRILSPPDIRKNHNTLTFEKAAP